MRRSGTWTTVGLIVLAVVAIVLAFAALRSTRGSAAPGPTASVLTKPSDKQHKGNGKNGGHDKDTGTLADALPDAIEPPLLLVSSSVAYRAQTGTCLGGSALERTTNGGVKWKDAVSLSAAILSLSSVGGDAVDVIGADDRCKTKVWSSTDQGETWTGPTSASGVFARVPDDPSKLATPNGEVKNPCPGHSDAPISVEGISGIEAAVLCWSGQVLTTVDSGATWLKKEPVTGGDAMAFVGPQLGWVLRADSGQCPAYQLMQTQDAGQTWQTGGCLGLTPIADDRELPSLSFADPNNGMADLAGLVYVTDDGGLHWHEAN
ncbi:MAG: WD40/YVTN/BNR-like repeat-containing protein [Actinomycetes bacterium]